MKPSKGYYCIIQYCPDLSRLESANIGVLIFCPERSFLKARTSTSNERIRKFFGTEDYDSSQISSLKKGIEERLQTEHSRIRTLKDLQRFVSLRANEVQISEPRPMRVCDPEKDLAELFDELVGDRHRQRSAARAFKTQIAERFAEAHLEAKIRQDLTVRVPILNEDMTIPFGFQNGRFNLIRPASFQAQNPADVVDRTCRYAVQGKSLYDHPDSKLGELQLIIVGQFREQAPDAQPLVEGILSENKVQLIPSQRLDELIRDIQQTGKILDPQA
ncbi:MAG: DUF3037 domain-containing protein [Planctomycetes bacterium]|nr:DUF3037 domain-containing protein [Planctomycetota bacterium]